MARKSGPTISQEELYPLADEPGREEAHDARLLDLDVEQEPPFLRVQKRVSVRRGSLPKKTVTRLTWAAVALGIVFVCGITVAALYHYGERSWRFRVESSDDIDISGLQNVTRAQVMEVMGGDIGRNIFFVPLAQRKAQLEQIPWVESASVMRFIPNRLKVEIHERTPVAFARVGSRILLTDAVGTLMELPGRKKYSFPVIVGMNSGEPPSTRAARMKIYNDVVSQLDSGGARYSQELSEIDLSDPDDVKVTGQQSRRRSAGPSRIFQLPGALQDLRHPRAGVAAAVRQTGIGGLALRPADHRQSGFAGSDEAAAAFRRSSQKGHGGGGEAGGADHAHQLPSPRPSPALTAKPVAHPWRSRLHQGPRGQRKDRQRRTSQRHASAQRETWSKARAKAKHAAARKNRAAKAKTAPKSVAAVKASGETEPGNCQGRNTIGMANQHEHLLTAIDVGSAKTCALVAEITDNGLRYRGHGVAESRGSRKGVIVDLDKAVSSIQKAVEQAEDVAGAPIEHALLGMAGAHARGFNSHGGLSFGARAREIGREELRGGGGQGSRHSSSRRSRNSAPAAAGVHSRRSDRGE